MISLYAEDLENGSTWGASWVRDYQLIAKTIAYLKVHYHEEITLQTLAKRCLSPQIIWAYFPGEMGCKFSDWLNHYRIYRAMELIKTIEMRTMDIAEAVGFLVIIRFFSVCHEICRMLPQWISALRTEENCRNKIKIRKRTHCNVHCCPFCELDRHAVTGAYVGVLKFWKDS